MNSQNTIVVRSSKNNTNYNKLKTQAEDTQIKSMLKQNKINLVEDLSGGPNDFNLYVYGLNGMLYRSMNKFDSFQDVINTYDSAKTHLNKLQSGGQRDYYKHKYMKYKSKYMKAKAKRT